MTSETYPWSFATQIFHNGQRSRGCDRKTFEYIKAEMSIRPTVLHTKKEYGMIIFIPIKKKK